MSSVDVRQRLPPPPPPMPPASPLSRSVSPLINNNISNNYTSAEVNHLSLPTTSYLNLRQPQIHIKPTTAGLLRFPALPDSEEQLQVVAHKPVVPFTAHARSLSPQFKQELLEKQSKISPSSSDANGATSIEDKIRLNKMNHHRSNTIQYDHRPFQQQQQHYRVPEKLMSAMQKETKPFAYTVNVSDPNNRGKLDLSQIKSPIMRRRLLANMNSTEEGEDDDDDDEEEGQIYDEHQTRAVIARNHEANMTIQPDRNITAPQAEQQRSISNKSISFSPVVSFSYGGDQHLTPQTDNNNDHVLARQRQILQEQRMPIIRYNEPPKFYSNYNSQQVRTAEFDRHQNSRGLPERSTMDRLDAEMAETLDDFERMLSDMSAGQQPSPSHGRQMGPFQSKPQFQQLISYNQPKRHHQDGMSCCLRGCQMNNNNDCCSPSPQNGFNKDERTSRCWLKTFQA